MPSPLLKQQTPSKSIESSTGRNVNTWRLVLPLITLLSLVINAVVIPGINGGGGRFQMVG